MKLVIINRSPRGIGSNTKRLTDWFLTGMERVGKPNEIKEFYLIGKPDYKDILNSVSESDVHLIAFPLYTDSMPSIVKKYFEKLGDYSKNKIIPPTGFIVQSGFPEGNHGAALSRYLKKFTHRLGCEYLGMLFKGGVEGVKIKPVWMTKSLRRKMEVAGAHFSENQRFSRSIIAKLARPQKVIFFPKNDASLNELTGDDQYVLEYATKTKRCV